MLCLTHRNGRIEITKQFIHLGLDRCQPARQLLLAFRLRDVPAGGRPLDLHIRKSIPFEHRPGMRMHGLVGIDPALQRFFHLAGKPLRIVDDMDIYLPQRPGPVGGRPAKHFQVVVGKDIDPLLDGRVKSPELRKFVVHAQRSSKSTVQSDETIGAHGDHQPVLDNGDRAHRQIEYHAKTGALDLPSFQDAPHDAKDAHSHHQKSRRVGDSRFIAREKQKPQPQLDERIDQPPPTPPCGQDVIGAIAVGEGLQVQQFEEREYEKKGCHKVCHPSHRYKAAVNALDDQRPAQDIREYQQDRLVRLHPGYLRVPGRSFGTRGMRPMRGLLQFIFRIFLQRRLQLRGRNMLTHLDLRRPLLQVDRDLVHKRHPRQQVLHLGLTARTGHSRDSIGMCHDTKVPPVPGNIVTGFWKRVAKFRSPPGIAANLIAEIAGIAAAVIRRSAPPHPSGRR